MKKLASLTVLLLGCIIIFNSQVASAESITAAGITVTPAIINLDLQKDQLTSSFDVLLTNNTDKPVTLSVTSVDFKSLNDTGGLTFIGSSVAEATRKHALANWLKTPAKPVTIAAKQSSKIPIIVDNRADLGPGGHYAAILYTISDVGGSAGATKISVNQVASTLVFVRKLDGARFGISLNKFRVTFSWFHIPTHINLDFKNTGNIQIVPRGLITVYSPKNKEVSRGQINTDSGLILPTNTRIYRTALFKTGTPWLPGVYKVHVYYHIDGSDELQYADSSFTFVNLVFIFEVILGIYLLRILRRKLIRRKTRKHLKKQLK